MLKYTIILFVMVMLLGGCSSDNEHFCARYQYVYKQLNDASLPSYNELKERLISDINKKKDDNDNEKFMLFVLEDFHSGIKPQDLEVKQWCLEAERWKKYF